MYKVPVPHDEEGSGQLCRCRYVSGVEPIAEGISYLAYSILRRLVALHFTLRL